MHLVKQFALPFSICRKLQHSECSGVLRASGQARIEKHNKDVAVRATDMISLQPGNAKPGRGGYKRWVPRAVLRICFGLESVFRKGMAKKRMPQTTMAASTSVMAAVNRASTTHIKQLRDGVACLILECQNSVFSETAGAPYVIVQVSLDETSEDVAVGADLGSRSIMMMHAKSMHRAGGQLREHEIIFPTTVLEDTTAESVLAAMYDRAEFLFHPRESGKLIVIVNSDSAPALKRMRRHFESLVLRDSGKRLHVDSYCQMHLMSAAIVNAFSPYSLVSPVFCATLQLRQGRP